MWVEDLEETVDDADYIQPTSESEEDESDSDLDSKELDGELANWQADLAKWRDLDIELLLEDSDTVVKSMESMTVKFEEIDTSQLQPAINLSTNTGAEQEQDLLFYVLEGNYYNEKLDFNQLNSGDRIIADLLRRCPFLEVHLAVVTQQTIHCPNDKGEPSCTTKFAIGNWINTKNLPQVNYEGIKINFFEQMVGDSDEFRIPTRRPFNEEKDVNSTTRQYNLPVLVLWPKHQTDRIYCQYGFQSILGRVESQLGATWLTDLPTIFSRIPNRTDLINDLRLALEYCRSQPLVTLKPVTGLHAKSGALRLLEFCNSLRAREEGLSLLQLLGTTEGVPDEKVAKTVANFVHTVTGKTSLSY